MEVMRIAGYTQVEKIAIAERHLVRKQLESHGLEKKGISFQEDALVEIIERYTREAGVRNVEREIASICRKLARKVVAGEDVASAITPARVVELLGIPRYHSPDAQIRESEIGVVNGLAWTEAGGEILNIEATLMAGRGQLALTGQLGDVMQESAKAALSFIRSRAEQYGLDPRFHRKYDLHIHLPEGAIPKDGPSAGISLATALTSLLCNIKVRHDVAMTGEVTLRGRVLPVGGIKEKVLAAYRYGCKEIVIPKDNEKDLSEIPEEIASKLQFHLVGHMEEVLGIALVDQVPNAELTKDESDPGLDGDSENRPVTH